MNLKNLTLIPVLLMTGCSARPTDQAFIDRLWKKTVQVTGISRKTPKPQIVILDEDLYQKILVLNCEFEYGPEQGRCLAERKALEDSVLPKTGRKYSEVYEWYVNFDRAMLEAECFKFPDKAEKKHCAEENSKQSRNLKVLGRTYLRNNYIEIYRDTIRDTSLYLPMSPAKREAAFYSVVAHEMLHVALHEKDLRTLIHHRVMRDKYMAPMIDYISDYEKIDHDGLHRVMAFKSLELGILMDDRRLRIIDRK